MQESTVQLKGPKSPTGVKMARDHVTVGEMSHDAHTVSPYVILEKTTTIRKCFLPG